MHRILLFIVFASAVFLKTENAEAQYLKIELFDGTEEAGELTAIRKLSFSDNNLVVDFKSGIQDLYSLSDINKLIFGEVVTSAVQTANLAEALTVYPNPVSETLYVKNLQIAGVTVTVYRYDGVLMMQKVVNDINEGIDVTSLAAGIYLIRMNNQTTKFIKQ